MKTTYPLDKTGYEALIAEQQAEIEELKKEQLKHLAEIKWLEDEDADLKKDAERYRWLRDDANDVHFWIYEILYLNGDKLDQAIDAAMGRK